MTDQQWCVPMLESEKGWGSKIDGYAGPFPDQASAKEFQVSYNDKHNSAKTVPDWYISARDPVIAPPDMKFTYRNTV